MSRCAILFIHGFSARDNDNEYLIKYLRKHSHMKVYNLTLPGHGYLVMKEVSFYEWINIALKKMNQLKNKYDKVYLIGHSMGGVIVSYLATIYPYFVKKIVLIAPAFQLGNFYQIKKDFINLVTGNNQYGNNGFEGILAKLFFVPKNQFKQLDLLIREYGHKVFEVKCPILFLHGDIDAVVSYKSTIDVYKQVKVKKRLTIVSGVRHRMFISGKKEVVSSYICSYLNGGLRWHLKKTNNL